MEIPKCCLLLMLLRWILWASDPLPWNSIIALLSGGQSLLGQPILKESCVFCTMYRVWHLASASKTYKKQAQQRRQTQSHHSKPEGESRVLRKPLGHELGIRLEISLSFYYFPVKSLLVENEFFTLIMIAKMSLKCNKLTVDWD